MNADQAKQLFTAETRRRGEERKPTHHWSTL